MILPKKHISLSESFFGFGAFLLEQLRTGKDTDELWNEYKNAVLEKRYRVKFSFDQFIMTLDYLFIIGAIKIDEKGVIQLEVN